MLNVKSRSWGYYLGAIAGLTLAGCSQQAFNLQSANEPLRATVVSPFDAKALGLRNLVSFDVYVDKQAVHAAFVATPVDGKQAYIAYLHSEDGGLHWSAPQALSEQFKQAVESKAGNDIQIAASGDKRMVMWQTRGELPGMGPLLTVYSDDAGNTWQLAANPAGLDGDQSHHDLAADAEGRFHAVWLDDRDENGYQGVRYARSGDTGRHWELAQTIDDSSCSCCWNRLAISANGKIDVLYRDMEFRDMALAQSADAGATWQRLGTVGAFNWKFDGCPHNGGGLSYAGDGSLHGVVWTGAENSTGLYHMQSADDGKNWMPPQRIGEGTAGFHADIAADAGRLVIVWDAMGPEGSQVYIGESRDNGSSWSDARLLSSPGASAEFPRIVKTSSGLLAMWSEQRPGAGKQWLSAVLQ
ncbi:MAG: glycoside hydrolase [Methylococcaceae bacterium]|nr:glycoside hydrolase [Methylococcaceae bacterium]